MAYEAFKDEGAEPTARAKYIVVSDIEAWLADEQTPLAALKRIESAVAAAIDAQRALLGDAPKAPRVRRGKGE